MAADKEIRSKIKSVENTKKITKAMEMVAASKMRKAQDAMRAARPYSDRVREIAAHISLANPEYKHPFMYSKSTAKITGIIAVTTDKGLCGGLNTNVLRAVSNKIEQIQAKGNSVHSVAIGNKGLTFFNRIALPVIANVTQLGDKPLIDKIITPVAVMLDAFVEGQIDEVYICYTKFINTMKQDVVMEKLLPLNADSLQDSQEKRSYSWDYLYEPEAQPIINNLMKRYVESIVYQAVLESVASEQSARMVAMKAATDNAGNVINELKLVYNKTRQAAITSELSEIVAGAAAV